MYGRFGSNGASAADCVDRIGIKYDAKWGVQITGTYFQTHSRVSDQRMQSFFSSMASAAAHAGQSQYFAPAALISLACAATFFALSAPKTCAPASDSAKAMRPSIGIISASSSAMYFLVSSASFSVPRASSQA
nr:DUF6783 domain-containing protein [Blautia coccoides]